MAIHLEQNFSDAYYNLGHLYQYNWQQKFSIDLENQIQEESKSQQQQKLEDQYQNAINYDQQCIEAYYQLGIFYQKNVQNYEIAIKMYNSVIENYDKFCNTFNNFDIAQEYYLQQNQKAGRKFKKIIKNKKILSLSYSNLGRIYGIFLKDISLSQKYYELAIKHGQDYQNNFQKYLNCNEQQSNLKFAEQLSLVFFQLAEIYQNQNNFKSAIDFYEQATQQKQNYPQAYFQLGYIQEKYQQFGNAEEYYKLALSYNNDYSEAYLRLGYINEKYFNINKKYYKHYQTAINFYKQAIQKKIDYAEAYLKLGNIQQYYLQYLIDNNNYNDQDRNKDNFKNEAEINYIKSIEFFQKMLNIEKDKQQNINVTNISIFESIDISLNQDNQQEDHNQSIIEYYYEALYSLGNLYANHCQKYQEAFDYYITAINLIKTKENAYLYLGNLYENINFSITGFNEKERYQKAEENYKKAISYNSDYQQALINLGLLYQKHFDSFDKAEKQFLQAYNLNKLPITQFYLGNFYFYDKNKYQKAKQHYENYIQNKQDEEKAEIEAELYTNLGIIYSSNKQTEDYKKAEQYFEIAIKKKSNYAKAYLKLGYFYEENNKIEKAEQFYQNAIKFKSDYPEAYLYLGILYNEQQKVKDFKKAENYYKQAIQHKKDYAAALHNLGQLYEEQFDYNKAEKYYLNAIKCKENTYLAKYNLGILYKSTFYNYKKALQIFRELKEKNDLKYRKKYEELFNQLKHTEKIEKKIIKKKFITQKKYSKIYKQQEDQIGQGQYGKVYQIQNQETKLFYAMKVIDINQSQDKQEILKEVQNILNIENIREYRNQPNLIQQKLFDQKKLNIYDPIIYDIIERMTKQDQKERINILSELVVLSKKLK